MKKIIICLLCCIMLAGCGGKKSDDKKNDHSTTYRWSISDIAKRAPKLEKKHGKIEFDRDDLFEVVIYDQSKKEYNSYVEKCYNAGFANKVEDFDIGGTLEHYAYDAENYRIDVEFYKKDGIEDKNSLRIAIKHMDDSNSNNNQNTNQTPTDSSGQVSADFKSTMDEYEKFFDRYVDFMKSYDKNNSTAEQLSKYNDFLAQYTKTINALNSIDENSLSDADQAYYIEVSGRITQKLLEVGQSLQ